MRLLFSLVDYLIEQEKRGNQWIMSTAAFRAPKSRPITPRYPLLTQVLVRVLIMKCSSWKDGDSNSLELSSIPGNTTIGGPVFQRTSPNGIPSAEMSTQTNPITPYSVGSMTGVG